MKSRENFRKIFEKLRSKCWINFGKFMRKLQSIHIFLKFSRDFTKMFLNLSNIFLKFSQDFIKIFRNFSNIFFESYTRFHKHNIQNFFWIVFYKFFQKSTRKCREISIKILKNLHKVFPTFLQVFFTVLLKFQRNIFNISL